MKNVVRSFLKASSVGLLLTGSLAHANLAGKAATTIGTNAHPFNTSGAYANMNASSMLSVLTANSLNRLRVDVNLAADTDPYMATKFQALLTAAKTQGIALEPVLMLPFSWGDRTDNGKYPAGDAAALYSQGYNRTYAFVNQFAADVQDWELENEINLIARDANGSPFYGKGLTAAEFNVSIMNDWSQVLKGMSDAIDAINTARSLKLRRIVGTTSSMFGYIDFMKSKGVKVDIVGYHYYEHSGVNPYQYWLSGAAPFDLFAKMASYNLPVHVNEFNCAEIYDVGYSNVAGSATMQTCVSNLSTMLKTFTSQTEANIESIQTYELLDQTEYGAPENGFGLLFNLSSAKPALAIVASYGKAALAPVPVASVSFASSASGTNGSALSLSPTLKNISGNLVCSAKNLPAGLSINASSCVISGTLAVTGTIPAAGVVQVATIAIGATSQSASISITILPTPVVSTTPSLAYAAAYTVHNNTAVSIIPVASNVPASLGCSGILLPNGLSVNANTCIISGTVSIAGLASAGQSSTVTIIAGAIGKVLIVNINVVP